MFMNVLQLKLEVSIGLFFGPNPARAPLEFEKSARSPEDSGGRMPETKNAWMASKKVKTLFFHIYFKKSARFPKEFGRFWSGIRVGNPIETSSWNLLQVHTLTAVSYILLPRFLPWKFNRDFVNFYGFVFYEFSECFCNTRFVLNDPLKSMLTTRFLITWIRSSNEAQN